MGKLRLREFKKCSQTYTAIKWYSLLDYKIGAFDPQGTSQYRLLKWRGLHITGLIFVTLGKMILLSSFQINVYSLPRLISKASEILLVFNEAVDIRVCSNKCNPDWYTGSHSKAFSSSVRNEKYLEILNKRVTCSHIWFIFIFLLFALLVVSVKPIMCMFYLFCLLWTFFFLILSLNCF